VGQEETLHSLGVVRFTSLLLVSLDVGSYDVSGMFPATLRETLTVGTCVDCDWNWRCLGVLFVP